MSETEKTVIITCSACQTLYKVPSALLGKEVPCKKCGKKFIAAEAKNEPALPLIGQVILNYNLAPKDKLIKAIETYASNQLSQPGQSLEQFLLADHVITEENMALAKDISRVWKKRQLEKQFAVLAAKSGFARPEDVKQALKEQAIIFQKSRQLVSIGDILVKHNQLTRQQQHAILKKQNRLDERPPSTPDKGAPPSETPAHPVQDEVKPPQSAPKVPPASPADTEQAPFPQETSASVPDVIDDAYLEQIKGEVLEGHGFEIIVSFDRIRAFFRSTDQGDDNVQAYDIIKCLDDEGITYGVMKMDKLKEELEANPSGEKIIFKIADGTPPEVGKPGKITIHFDTEPPKAGKVDDTGQIDFKDRGEIPHVKEGELLAERIPATQGIPGIDIYGDPIHVEEIEDHPLLFGSGVLLSEDGLKLFAKVKGQPQLSPNGKVSVLDELKIQGDVGYKTGHIDFDGNITITGTIQNGFKVKGGNVKAKEVNGAELELSGSLTVSDGITDSVIHALGDVTAKFISKSTIVNFENILVAKQIIDSKVTCGGSCKAPGGKIISSEISAKNGVEAVDIGTAMSKPCKLKAGSDDHLAKEIGGINNAIERQKSAMKECKDAIANLTKEEEQTHKLIAENAHIQDRSQIEQRAVRNEIKTVKESGDTKAVSQLEAKIRELEQNARKAENEINALFERQDKILEMVELHKERLPDFEKRLWELTSERKNILEYAKKEKGIAIIKATGTIYAGTTITGVHSSRVVSENVRKAQIKEVRVTDPDSTVEYEMRLIK